MARQIDWDSIEVHYRTGIRSLRDIGSEFGVSEAAIRQKAKKMGWLRNPAALKRERVNARVQGSQPASQETARRVECEVDAEVDADVEDMNRGLRVYRKILERLENEVETVRGFKALKVIGEAATIAVNGIRRIRGLDAPIDLGKLSDEELMALAKGKSPR